MSEDQVEELPLSKIRIDGDTEPRAQIQEEVVEEYRHDMARGVKFPAVRVVFDGEHYWLYDGFHRYKAARLAGRKMIRAMVRQGSRTNALWLAVGSNQFHGLRRNLNDKAWAVTRAIKLRPDRSNRFIARHVGVSNKTVSRRRADLESTEEIPQLKRLRGADGRWRPARASDYQKPKGLVGVFDELRYHAPWRRDNGRWAAKLHALPNCDWSGHRLSTLSQAARERMEEVFDRRREIDRIIKQGKKLQCDVMMIYDKHSPIFIGFDFGRFDAKMEEVLGQLRSICPQSVCPKCQGVGCEPCQSRGWVTSERLNELDPPPPLLPVEVA